MVDEVVELLGREVFGLEQVGGHAGVEVTGTGTHHQAGGRRKAHARVLALAIQHGSQAGSTAQVRQNNASRRYHRSRLPAQLLQQVGVGNTVKPVASQPLRRKAAR